jgi:hypothetical protein
MLSEHRSRQTMASLHWHHHRPTIGASHVGTRAYMMKPRDPYRDGGTIGLGTRRMILCRLAPENWGMIRLYQSEITRKRVSR